MASHLRRVVFLLEALTHKFTFIGLMSLLALPTIAHAQDQQDAQQKLEQLKNEIDERKAQQVALEKKSQEALSEAERLSQDLVILARDIRIAEDNATRLEDRISILEAEEAHKKTLLDGKQSELLELLSALERLSKRPVALALLRPEEAITTARSASLLGTIVPDINDKAEVLKKELASLDKIQQDLSSQRFQLKNTLVRLTDHQLKVGSLVRRRQSEARKASQSAQNIAQEIRRFAQEAATLKELIDKLAQRAAKKAKSVAKLAKPDRKKPNYRPTSRPITSLKGSLPFPVTGRVIKKFGAKEAVGEARGIKIESRPGAQVVAPYDGRIVFAGPFREYGQLLIIEHGNGYHSLMAGFGELYGAIGQWVLTGEPVGVMAAAKKLGPLYVELRRGGQAINPEPWLDRRLTAAN